MNMNDILIIVLVLIGAPIIGCLASGIDRKITADCRVESVLLFCSHTMMLRSSSAKTTWL
jgi:hypothetical protein